MYRVLYVSYVRRGVTVRDNGIYGLKSSAILKYHFSRIYLHASAHYTLYYTLRITLCAITPLSAITLPKEGVIGV